MMMYRKFDLMMSVIEVLKIKTGFIFRINIVNQNGKCRCLINKKDLNKRKILELDKIVNINDNSDTIDVTKFYLKNKYGSADFELNMNSNDYISIDYLEQQAY